MEASRIKAILVLVAALAFASAPFWSGSFGGFDPDRFPIPQVDPPAQRAGYAFAIWGPIYLWLVAVAGFGLVARAEDPDWDAHRWLLFASLAIGATWISVAQVSPLGATILIWIMLATALAALFRAPAQDRWLARAPMALYAGWLTAASCVSLALLGAGYGVVLGQVGWAVIAVALASLIAAAVVVLLRGPIFYAAAVIWALVAVIVQNLATQPVLAGLAGLAAVGLAVLAIRGERADMAAERAQAARSTQTGT
jgi:hypothetical protein